MLKLKEVEIIQKALKLTESARTGDAIAAKTELDKIDPEGMDKEVGNVLHRARGLTTSYSLRKPEDRKTYFFENSFRELKQNAESLL